MRKALIKVHDEGVLEKVERQSVETDPNSPRHLLRQILKTHPNKIPPIALGMLVAHCTYQRIKELISIGLGHVDGESGKRPG